MGKRLTCTFMLSSRAKSAAYRFDIPDQLSTTWGQYRDLIRPGYGRHLVRYSAPARVLPMRCLRR